MNLKDVIRVAVDRGKKSVLEHETDPVKIKGYLAGFDMCLEVNYPGLKAGAFEEPRP